MKELYSNSDTTAFNILQDRSLLYPFEIVEVSQGKKFENLESDMELQIRYGNKSARFLVEIKNRSVPQIVERGIGQIKKLINIADENYYPALLVPYLSNSVVDLLKENNISGIDLNGNYFIVTDEIVGIRLDRKNEYKESAPIKNVYSGNSSIVGRFLLKEKRIFNSVNEIYKGVRNSGGDITLSTVSKVLSRLSDDLIIQKDKKGISLLQPQKLLQKLKNNYKPPEPIKILRLKLSGNREEARSVLNKYFGKSWMWSGESSADYYASTTLPSEFTIFTNVPYREEILNLVDMKFYNCTLLIISQDQNYLFFGSTANYASKVQTYLELMQLDKREKEVAIDIEREILNGFESQAK
ncbi:MAG: hypothetical protein Q8933_20700 [Bacteroidota bacterium]|nr:hypothetical protein [Bacteroidota bacterium]MDP4196720.1 hypothetical protein [Bacteroidota bacterium]